MKPVYDSKKEYKELLEGHVDELSALQRLHFASNRYALLLIFQGMDAAGKDGAVRHVMSGVNPAGCQVWSFKQPSAEELEHDFLWRTTCRLPERGRIGIFNRSYYEEVLVVRVHPEILRNQGLAEELRDEKTIWDERYRSIVDLERHLYRNGTRTVKVFLHLSKGEQKKRFLARIDEPEKNWKFSLADIHERKYWSDYMRAYEECIARHEYPPRSVVRCSRRRQGECPADCFPDCHRCARRPQDVVSQDHAETPGGIESHRQGAGEVTLNQRRIR